MSVFDLVFYVQHIPDDGQTQGCFFVNLLNSSQFSLKSQRYLLQQDPNMFAAAKALIEECCEKSKSGDPQFRCICTSTKARLKSTVGEFHWKKAQDYVDHLLKQKREAHQMEIIERVQQQGQVQQQRSRAQQQSRGQQQQVMPPSADHGGDPSLTVSILTPPPQQSYLSTPSQFAATATQNIPMSALRHSRTAEPPSTDPVLVPVSASAPTNATCKPSATAVTAPTVPLVDLTSKKKAEARKRKKLPNLQVLEMHPSANKLKKGVVHASMGLVKLPPPGGLSTASTTTTSLSIGLDFSAAKSYGDATKNSRKMFREEFSNNMASRRDHHSDNPSFGLSSKDDRCKGAANRRFADRFSQREAQLYNQQYEVEVLKLNSVLRSKSGQRDARIQLAHLYNTIGDTDKAKLELEQVGDIISAITKIEEDLMQQKNRQQLVNKIH